MTLRTDAVVLIALNIALASCAQIVSKGCPGKLKLVRSAYHQADHCVCPENHVCEGPACSLGHASNGEHYHAKLYGYRADCSSCICTPAVSLKDFDDFRRKRMMWIIGTHHKTGSFLSQRIWSGLHTIVKPSLKLHSSQFQAMDAIEWKRVAQEGVDIVVTFQVQDINQSLVELTGRPYRFVHLVRDPVATIVSAYLYETQRPEAHDRYHKVVQRAAANQTAALEAMAAYMMTDLELMEQQFLESERDHNALNVKLEDFQADFDDTLVRIFHFLGVPAMDVAAFVHRAQREDLARKQPEQLQEAHITRGKYDKRPLLQAVFDQPVYQQIFRRMKANMRYACCP